MDHRSGAGCHPPFLLRPETCLSGSRGPSPTVLKVLSLAVVVVVVRGSDGTFNRASLHVGGSGGPLASPGTDPGRPFSRWSRGAPACVRVCVCSASASMQTVPCGVCSSRGWRPSSPGPLARQGLGYGLRARPWAGLWDAPPPHTCLVPPLVGFDPPSCPQLLEQESLGRPLSPASGRS